LSVIHPFCFRWLIADPRHVAVCLGR
jgi:hypothetical protein